MSMMKDNKKQRWTTARAKQRLSELLRAAAREPQFIFNRDRAVAVLLDVATYEEFRDWCERRSKPSLEEAFAELRQICAEEGYSLDTGAREDRPNPFPDVLDDVPR